MSRHWSERLEEGATHPEQLPGTFSDSPLYALKETSGEIQPRGAGAQYQPFPWRPLLWCLLAFALVWGLLWAKGEAFKPKAEKYRDVMTGRTLVVSPDGGRE